MRKEDFTMDTYKIGQVIQNFEMDVYDPIKRDFGKISFLIRLWSWLKINLYEKID